MIGGGGPKLSKNALVQQQISRNNDNLILRFCPPAEINKQRQKRIVAQSCFLAKIKHMKYQGQKQKVMEDIDLWLDSYLAQQISQSNTLRYNIARTKTSKFISTERQMYKISMMKDQLMQKAEELLDQ